MKIVRALKFEVRFPGWRKADLFGKQGLLCNLTIARNEVTLAANRLISAMFAMKLGHIPLPTNEDGSPVAEQSLYYQGLSGKWQPQGKPMYTT